MNTNRKRRNEPPIAKPLVHDTRTPAEPGGYLPEGANGRLPLTFAKGWLEARTTLVGGPFKFCPDDMAGVCLLERGPAQDSTGKRKPCAVHLPIEDFKVPEDPAALTKALQATLRRIIAGETVYVGCMGGWGRTGLFLALLAKVSGIPDPVGYVRKHYTPRAVETSQQRQFVDTFETAGLRRWMIWPLFKQWLRVTLVSSFTQAGLPTGR